MPFRNRRNDGVPTSACPGTPIAGLPLCQRLNFAAMPPCAARYTGTPSTCPPSVFPCLGHYAHLLMLPPLSPPAPAHSGTRSTWQPPTPLPVPLRSPVAAPRAASCPCIHRHSVNLPAPQFSSAKIKRELGCTFLDLSCSLKDMAETMAAVGLLPKLD